jgi:hypothetical protein
MLHHFFFLNEVQSQRPDNSSSLFPTNYLKLLGILATFECGIGPSSFAISIEAVTAAKYNVSNFLIQFLRFHHW